VDLSNYTCPTVDLDDVHFYACLTWTGTKERVYEEGGVFPETWFSKDFRHIAVPHGCYAYKQKDKKFFKDILVVEADWIQWDVSRFVSDKKGQ